MRHPGLSKLKCTSMCILPWQNHRCEATLKGHTKLKAIVIAIAKAKAKAKAKRKSWIPVFTGMTIYCSVTHMSFAVGFCFFLLAHSAIYRTAQADQGKSAMDGGFSFDKQGRASKRP